MDFYACFEVCFRTPFLLSFPFKSLLLEVGNDSLVAVKCHGWSSLRAQVLFKVPREETHRLQPQANKPAHRF